MNNTIWLALGMIALLTFVFVLLPKHSSNRIPIHIEDDNAIPSNLSTTSGNASFDTYYVLHNYCMLEFPVMNPLR
jgi:hypothetical protein